MSVKWIKLSLDLFSNRKIKQIRTLPDGDALVVIWFQLLCLAGQVNDNGMVYFSRDIPYTDEMLATEFDRPVNTIRLALNTFESFHMIEIVDNILLVSNWEKYQSVDKLEQIRNSTKNRVAQYRERQKLLAESSSECNVTCNDDVTLCNALDIDIDIDIEEDIDREEKIIKQGKSKKATSRFAWEKELSECGFSRGLQDAANKWFLYKSERNQPYKPTGISTLLKRITNRATQYGDEAVIDLIDESVANNWMGIAWDKLKTNKAQARVIPQKQSSSDKMLELIREGAFGEPT